MSATIKILYLEHITGAAMPVVQTLTGAGIGVDLKAVNTPRDYKEALSGFSPTLIIANDTLPGVTAKDALTALKQHNPSIPFIALASGSTDMAQIVSLVKQGAFDYIPKEDIHKLPAAVLLATENLPSLEKPQLSEQSYRQIVETAQEGIWILNQDLITVFVNKKTCDMLGYTADEIIGRRNTDFREEEDIVNIAARAAQRRMGKAETHESTFITKSGQRVQCIVATNGLFDANGAYMGSLAMLTDITGRKAHENALKHSEANLSAIIENTTDLVYSLDRDLKVITYNQLFKNTIKHVYGFDIHTGASTLDMISDFDAEMGAKWKAIYQRALDGETQQFVNEYTFGPEKVYLSYSINPIRESGQVIGLSCFSRDITKQKLDEAEREKITADLLQRNKALEQFTYIISHNLRAPVANIIGLSSLLSNMTPDANEIEDIVDSISRSANKLDDTILDLNRILQVSQTPNENIERIKLPKLVDDIKLSIRHLIEKDQVIIHADFEISEIVSLKSFIHSILYNLILNSIKYRNPVLQPYIAITAKAANGKITISYRDNGRGIDTSKYSEEIFGLYKRFDTSVEGKGIGLFMVKTQVESLGGTIAITSVLNKGTEFIISLPQQQLMAG